MFLHCKTTSTVRCHQNRSVNVSCNGQQTWTPCAQFFGSAEGHCFRSSATLERSRSPDRFVQPNDISQCLSLIRLSIQRNIWPGHWNVASSLEMHFSILQQLNGRLRLPTAVHLHNRMQSSALGRLLVYEKQVSCSFEIHWTFLKDRKHADRIIILWSPLIPLSNTRCAFNLLLMDQIPLTIELSRRAGKLYAITWMNRNGILHSSQGFFHCLVRMEHAGVNWTLHRSHTHPLASVNSCPSGIFKVHTLEST
jgi:hypothetical protein